VYDVSLLRVGAATDALPPGVDAAHREDYLSDEQFRAALGCTREAFRALPAWRQADRKRNAKLL
jgi:hypothetical protein